MESIVERTIGQTGYELLQIVAAKEVGFNRLLSQLHMNNHTLRKELQKLEKEGYVEKRPRKEFEQRSGPGRPEEPYRLTEKGTKYFAVIKELEDLGPLHLRIVPTDGRPAVTYEQYVEKRRKAYDQLGIPFPTAKEIREENLDFFADQVRNLHPNVIMLIETLNGEPRCTVLMKPFYVVKKEKLEGCRGRRIVIEPT